MGIQWYTGAWENPTIKVSNTGKHLGQHPAYIYSKWIWGSFMGPLRCITHGNTIASITSLSATDYYQSQA